MGKEILRMEHIVKLYSNGILAANQVDFSLEEGEIHALAGENGAGKSTLMKILYGVETADEGRILLNGKEIQIKRPQDAISYGIGMVYQHFKLINSMSVAENMKLGDEPRKGIFVDKKRAVRETALIAEKYHMDINPNAIAGDLNVGQKQKVEILKVLDKNAKIIILDEPTAVLTPQETEKLFEQLKELRAAGHTIIFISHKINEIYELCDRITILRSAKTVGTYRIEDVDKADISNLIVGYEFKEEIHKNPLKSGKDFLTVENLNLTKGERKALSRISLSVKRGEILGIAGIEGNGQGALISCLTGGPFDEGSIYLEGKKLDNITLNKMRDLGIAYIPEDRIAKGGAAELTIEENILSRFLDDSQYTGRLFVKGKNIRKRVGQLIDEYSILCNGTKQRFGMLSGGNMQKVIAAREMSIEPELVIAEQPTRGIDVGAARIIHNKFLQMRDDGKAVILVSADINELLKISDRIVVMFNGMIAAVFCNVSELSEQELGLYMLGVKRQEYPENE